MISVPVSYRDPPEIVCHTVPGVRARVMMAIRMRVKSFFVIGFFFVFIFLVPPTFYAFIQFFKEHIDVLFFKIVTVFVTLISSFTFCFFIFFI